VRGSAGGTRLVDDIDPGVSNGFVDGSYPIYLTNAAGVLFFSADDGVHGYELWRSDGTAEGTTLVADIKPGRRDSDPGHTTGQPPRPNMRAIGATLFFGADDGVHGRELWRSDGTAATTKLVRDIGSGGGGSGNSSPEWLTNLNGTLFFSAIDDRHGRELWRSNGTRRGTKLVRDINPGTGNSLNFLSDLRNVAGRLFFSANDGSHGYELWKAVP
jgi:ELWxxDGT repeat protein